MWGKKKKEKKAQKPNPSRGSLIGGPREDDFGTFNSTLTVGKTRPGSEFFATSLSNGPSNDHSPNRRFNALSSRFQEEEEDHDDDDEGFVISGISAQEQEGEEEVVIISSTNESTTPSSTHFTREMSDRVLVLTATATTQDIYAQEEDEDTEDEFVICGFTQDQSEPPAERKGTFEHDLWSFLKNVAPGTERKEGENEEVEEEEEEDEGEEEEEEEEEEFVIFGVEELEEEEEEEFDICGIEEKEESDEEEFEIVMTSIQTEKILQEQQQQHRHQQQQRKQQQHQRQQAAARGRGRGRGGGSVGRGEEKKRKDGFLKGKQSKRTKSKANLAVEEEIENFDPEVRYAMEQGTKVIKAITLPRLIDQLALEGGVRETFLITYRAFMTPELLLDMLMDRYQEEKDEDDPGILMKKKVRLAGVVKAWLERYFSDFEEENVATKLLSFLDRMEKSMATVAAQLKKTYQKSVDNTSSSSPLSLSSPTIYLEGEEKEQAELLHAGGWVKLSERDIAEQMTIIESELYKKTLPKEYLAWNKKEKEILSPNICRMIQQFNKVSNWVRSLIVAPPRLKDRVELLEKFVRIMGHLFEMNNFNGLMEILSALNNGAVRRMKKTWEAISQECKENLKKIEKLLSHEYSYGAYRKQLHEIKPPCVPYLGVYLTDLTFVLDGNSDKVKGEAGEMINFFKFRKVAGIIFEIQQYQTTYEFQPLLDLNNYLQTLKSTSEEACYRCSSRAEPKNVEKAVGDLIRTETELKNKLDTLKNTHNTLQIRLNTLLGLIPSPPPPPPPSSLCSSVNPRSPSIDTSPRPPPGLSPSPSPLKRASPSIGCLPSSSSDATPPPKPKKPGKPSKPVAVPAKLSSSPLPPPLSPHISPSSSPPLGTSSPSPPPSSSPSPPPSSSPQLENKRQPQKQFSHQTLRLSSSPSPSSPPLSSPKRLSKKTSLRGLSVSASSSLSSGTSPNMKRKSLWKGKIKGGEEK